jgi:CubicO group peptidase (beta-lactamase class C family)
MFVTRARHAVALIIATASPLAAQQDTVARIDSLFASAVKEGGPGCSVGVGRSAAPQILRSYGLASIEFNAPITPATRFDAASMAKQFTAASIALLARQGKISLTDNVRKYIPELPDYGAPVTIQNLLDHTSGIRDQWDLLWLTGGHDDDATEEEDVVSILARQKALNFSPGSEFVYSNSGYTLLGLIVRKVSGLSLRQFARQFVFAPLGMSDTNFLDDRFEILPNVASGYRHARSSAWSPSPYLYDTYGAGGLFTTAADMLRWYASFDDSSRAPKLARSRLATGDSIPYAMGLDLGRYRGNKYAGHGGNDLGANAYGFRFLDRDLSVVILCNGRDIDAYTLARRVADLFLPTSPAQAAPATSAARSTIQVPAAALARYAGIYFNPLTLATREVQVRNGRLVWARGDGTLLDAVAPNRFAFPPGQPAELLFPDRQRGKPQVMQVLSGGTATTYYGADKFVTPRSGMKEYAGNYYSDELETTWHVSVSDSSIHVATLGSWGFDAQPIMRDGFAVPDAVVVRFTRDKLGRITDLVADMPRTRGVRFKRLTVTPP